MKTKKTVAIICILLTLSILLTACDRSGKQKRDQFFYGNPDMETIDEEGFIYQKDLETKWVDEPMIQGMVEWGGSVLEH